MESLAIQAVYVLYYVYTNCTLYSVNKGIGSDQLLTTICEVLYGQLEGFVKLDDPVISEAWKQRDCSREDREKLLGDYISFLNTLMSVSDTMFDVLSSAKWFNLLLRIIDIQNDTGIQY